MAKAPELVVVVFKKPDNCKECPCSYFSEGDFGTDYCQLKSYTDGYLSECELGFHNDVFIPDWCPLKNVKFTK